VAQSQREIRLAAIRRAEVLLREHLTPDQLVDFDTTKGFNVLGSDNEWYRINQLTLYDSITATESHNVSDSVGITYCTFPFAYDMPWPDIMLAQKLFLETDADKYMRQSCTSSTADIRRWGRPYGGGDFTKLTTEERRKARDKRQAARTRARMREHGPRLPQPPTRIVVRVPKKSIIKPPEEKESTLVTVYSIFVVLLIISFIIMMVLAAVRII
jgi:hypothetical protein